MARLVCGTVSVVGLDGRSNERLYSIVIVETLFGTDINDGFTPVTAAENQGLSDQTCASLRANAVAHANASLH
jgi:hypothetical protein